MASASKRPRSANYSVEEALGVIFARDEDHLGMSSDEESEIDRELDYQSGISRSLFTFDCVVTPLPRN